MATDACGLLARAIRIALGGVLVLPTVSVAQDLDNDTAQLDRITVTGSRIKRAAIESASPILVLEQDQIEQTGQTALGDLLQDLPIAGSALNTQFNNGGNGSTFIDLRNLGANRVLVLLNGRRFISGLGGIVDLNNIPVAIIKRIEILKDGASSVYGSDAITGVINILTREDFEGLQANAYVGQYEAENDGEIQAYDFSVGITSERGSVFFNASHVKAEPVSAGDRRISREPQFGTGTALGSTTTPQGRFGAAALGSFGLTTDPGANVTGPGGLGVAAFRPGDFSRGSPGAGADRFNFAPDNYMLTPQERTNVFTQGTYELTDNVRLMVEASLNNRRSEQLLAPEPLLLGVFTGGLAGSVGVAADNRYNPFGIDLDPSSSFLLGRRMVESGPRIFRQDVDSYRFGLGLTGSFEWWGRHFDWDLNYVYGNLGQSDVNGGQLNIARVRQALSGQPCRDDVNNDGCVELNVFGGQGADGTGTITREMLDYILYTENSAFGNELRDYTATVTGELLEMPAGPLGFAAGYEYRQEEGFDSPDSLLSAGIASDRPRPPIEGSFSVDELYLEFSVPLLSGSIGAERLDLSLSTRYSDYDTFGDTTNSKIGIEWQPIDDLLLRATWSEGFRAPPIADLFRPEDDRLVGYNDPCNGVDTDGDGVGDTNPGHAGCVGIPGDYVQATGAIRPAMSSSPSLEPESSESVTAGLVYSPAWLDGLDITVDYYNIELDNAITRFSVIDIVRLCALTGSVLCGFVTRDPVSGQITDLIAAPANIGGSKVDGADMLLSYSFPETDWGFFRVLWLTTYQGTNEDRVADPSTGELEVVSNIGLQVRDAAFPRIKSHLDLNWSRANWEAAWGLEYIHGSDEFCFLRASFGFCNLDIDGDGDSSDGRRIGGTTYHDAQVSYHVPRWDARLTLGVQNAFDKGPPLSTAAFDNSYNRSDYRVPGRFPYVRITVDF